MSRTPIALAIATCVALGGIAIAAPQTAAPGNPYLDQLDTNKDGFIDRTEAAKHPRLLQRFDQLDANKDGRISADERPVRRGMMGGKRGGGMMGAGKGPGGMRGMQLDTDKDRRISRAEAAAAPQFAQRFDQMDVNKDGFVDRTDQQARMHARRAEWFTAMDTNGDGQISRAEYDAAHAKRMTERQQQRAARRGATR